MWDYIYMPVWSREEVESAARLLEKAEIMDRNEVNCVLKRYTKYGGIARATIATRREVEEYEKSFVENLSQLAKSYLIDPAADLPTDKSTNYFIYHDLPRNEDGEYQPNNVDILPVSSSEAN